MNEKLNLVEILKENPIGVKVGKLKILREVERAKHPNGRTSRRCNFYEWCITNGWRKGLSIDRLDNDKGYYPDNCRFVDAFVQARNKRIDILPPLKRVGLLDASV